MEFEDWYGLPERAAEIEAAITRARSEAESGEELLYFFSAHVMRLAWAAATALPTSEPEPPSTSRLLHSSLH